MTTAQLAKSTQPSSTAGAIVLSTTDGNNVIQADVTYYIKFNVYLGDKPLTAGDSLPYIWVYSDNAENWQWTVAKTGTTNGGVVLPVSKVGQYRFYIREPQTADKIGNTFNIPYHAADLTSYPVKAVQPLYTIDVTEATNGVGIKTLFPIKYLDRPETGKAKEFYPVSGIKKVLTNKNTLRNPLKLDDYTITYQLWSDASQAYGSTNSYIAKSKYSAILKTLYNSVFTAEIVDVKVNNKVTQQETKNGRVLSFNDGDTNRKLIFQDNATQNARYYKSFLDNKKMSAQEAIRRTHPSAFEYVLQLMHDLDITEIYITSAWRPALGSILHRYSVGVDIGTLKGNVKDDTTNKTHNIAVYFKNELVRQSWMTNCDPTRILNAKNTLTEKLAVKLSKMFFVYIAEDRLWSVDTFTSGKPKLGWLGGPWQLYAKTLGIQVTTDNPECVHKDYTHKDHVHLTLNHNLV
ncbi:hypothetical protein MTZ49_15735 (plasmid) [Entomomonas sp. E2T0]|uniref:hypothetical protein n=1 Tax=Entomomonas sp. E2T0 TaxID=2930213 RepID=UPI0022283845|nr:hypothetical protein [Entomomonas sp. E2T0]UYZ85593.1 hypothetical protein MTZ49_15735 [Entomomonas sp. E2T0]